MRQGRLLVPSGHAVGYYHCFSRVVDRRPIFNDTEKQHLLNLLRECEAFCEVNVLTFCILSNHFHLLVEVPKPPAILPSIENILKKLEALSGFQDVGLVRQELQGLRERKDSAGEAALHGRYLRRLWNLSAFMKLLKQRFTQWFNARNQRQGTLWESRFHSLLVDGSGRALPAVAGYIDLNPVRAGLVTNPKDYRWSGYGEAVAGKRISRLALQKVVRVLRRGQEESLTQTLRTYRMHLYKEGHESRESLDEHGRPVRGVLKHEDVLKVLRNKGRLELTEYLQCRVRYFCDGAVMGSRAFVEEVFQHHRKRFGPKRRNGAHRLKGLHPQEELFVLRNLRLDVFG